MSWPAMIIFSLRRDTEEECNSVDFGENNEYIDYEKLYNGRFNLLKKAYKRSNPEDEGFKKFVEENGFWIEDYAMFMAIKAEHNGESFELWEDEIRVRKPEAMERYREKFHQVYSSPLPSDAS